MGSFDLVELGAKLGIFFVPFLFSLCFHEYAHGLVAKWRGDRTAEMAGRLSLNPMVHADPMGTWILPIATILLGSPFFFGWATPVPVNTRNLRHRLDLFWVSLAGPASNVLLAILAAILLGFTLVYMHGHSASNAIMELLKTFVRINLFLAVFNLIPIHPLDGGKIIEPFLPARWNIWLMENQAQLNMFLFVFIMFAGGLLSAPVLWATQLLLELSVTIARALV
jgi:Zn-dependent protease